MSLRHLRNARGFFSDYYLSNVFGQGVGRGRVRRLTDRETDQAFLRFRRIRERAAGRAPDAPTCRERFVRPFLRDVLGYHLGAGEDRIHPLFRSAEEERANGAPLLLAYCGAWDEDLDAGRGSVNPMHRLGQALSQLKVPYGLLVTGERLRLIRAPGDGPRGSYLEVDVEGLADDEEDLESFAAVLHLLRVENFLQGADGQRPIEAIEAASREHAERVSEDLKRAVFRAAETMVSALIADRTARGLVPSPTNLSAEELNIHRDAALLALYRILFILYAEARDPRLDEHELYRKSYSAHSLLEEVLQNADRAWPENRCSLWEQLRALFRIYDDGLPPITPWQHIPPRGGQFFSRTTPTGRILDEARLSDRQVAQVMLDLATTTPRRGVGRERVSFRELDIESLGSVYEGLLEYELRIAQEPLLEVRLEGNTYALAPAEVVRLCRERNLTLRGDFVLVAGTVAEALHPDASEDEEAEEALSEDAVEADGAGEEDEAEADSSEEVRRGGTLHLVRRLKPGEVHFVPGPGRKGSGSYYTPRPLVRDLVHHALGPLVEGKKAADIERLRVLDPACGSAHFLVEAMRFLGQALHRAYVQEYGQKGPPHFRPSTRQGWDTDWRASDEQARAANSEARAWCKRRIAERCLFGVDVNPTAVELARVALWIESLAGDRPLTYFDHHIRVGNSLLGTWMDRLDKAPLPTQGNSHRLQGTLGFEDPVRRAICRAAEQRRLIDEADAHALLAEGIEPESVDEQAYKDLLREQADQTLQAAKLLFDLRSASVFVPEIWSDWVELIALIHDPARLRAYAESCPWWSRFEEVRKREHFFHWELEFPEVFVDQENPGFDAVLGNPPWDKIKPDRKEFYQRYDILVRALVGGDLDRRIRELHAQFPGLEGEFVAYERRVRTLAACLRRGGDYRYQDWEVESRTTGGDPDAFRFFVERAWQLACEGGRVGFVVPSAVYNNEGCTGLRHLLLNEATVERFYAFENRQRSFPIDSRYKFVNLVFRKGKPVEPGFAAAFMRHDLQELDATARYREPGREHVKPIAAPWIVPIRRAELERLSPGTLAFLEYRSARDREILLKMYGYDAHGNPVNPRPLLGAQGPGTWNARFYTEFHMTNNRDLWTDPRTSKLYNPRQILGSIPGTTDRHPYYDIAAWHEIRARMAEKGFWPLYEGKHIEQFLVDIKPIERWVSLEACEDKYKRHPDPGPKLVFRAIASSTNERTSISAVLPPHSCFGHSLYGCFASVDLDVIATVANSFSFDYSLRLRVSANVSPMYLKLPPVPELNSASFSPIPTTSAVDTKVVHITDARDLWKVVWLANHAVAEAYGLGPADFEHILSTFTVFARKRPEFYAYLLERVREWKQEAAPPRRALSLG